MSEMDASLAEKTPDIQAQLSNQSQSEKKKKQTLPQTLNYR